MKGGGKTPPKLILNPLNNPEMKKRIYWAGYLPTLLFILLSATVSAQYDRSNTAVIGINIPEFQGGQSGAIAGIHFLRHFGLYVRGSYRDFTETKNNFTHDTKGRAYGGSLRVFPFGPSRNHQLGTFSRRGFRATAPSGSSWAEVYMAGLHFDIGYEFRNMDLTFTPNESLNSPFADFQYHVKDNSLTLQAGYGISLSHFYIDIGYRLRLSQPTWEGPVDIFTDELQSTLSLDYLPSGALQLTIGAAL